MKNILATILILFAFNKSFAQVAWVEPKKPDVTKPIRIYCDINKPVRDLVNSVGYECGVTCRFDVNKSDTDRLMLNRSVILSIDSLRVFEQKISGAWDWYKYRTMNR